MTLREWLGQAEAQLSAGPHPDRARLDAETLLLHLIGKNKAWLMAHADDDFAGCSAIRYASLLERRRKGEPIQYITGETEFYGLPFRVTPDVLIPRPETEHLVEQCLALATRSGAPSFRPSLQEGWESKDPASPIRILDVGTGSGAIAVALASQLPNAVVTATDISKNALAIARENARPQQDRRPHPLPPRRSSRPRRRRALRDRRLQSTIRPRRRPRLPFRRSPRPRARAGSLRRRRRARIYRRLIPQAFAVLVPGGFIALEIGYGQQPAIHSLLADCRIYRPPIHARSARHSPRRRRAAALESAQLSLNRCLDVNKLALRQPFRIRFAARALI